ncbi:DUF3306 domain-containing protein [Aurantimonas sp. A2-1-M11]|uniref:DUF3306 domain-containing protein n=1 Tax=Aurantimonas sp. A2-1-M11 TaxID=3113712 RepID=UPI002F9509AC
MADGPEDGDNFLSRWSRRKRDVEAAEAAETQLPEAAEIDPEALAREAEELEQNRIAAEAVDIDSMKAGDDFGLFLKRGVPDLLRRKALRKLWRSNPVFANLDGLNDYDEDFRNPAHNRYTSLWQLGRGFLSIEEQDTQRATGRLTRPEPDADELAAGTDDQIAADEMADTEESGTEGVLREEPQTDQAGADTGSVPATDDAFTPPAKTGEPPAATPEPIPVARAETPAPSPARRVSIRQRLQG